MLSEVYYGVCEMLIITPDPWLSLTIIALMIQLSLGTTRAADLRRIEIETYHFGSNSRTYTTSERPKHDGVMMT